MIAKNEHLTIKSRLNYQIFLKMVYFVEKQDKT